MTWTWRRRVAPAALVLAWAWVAGCGPPGDARAGGAVVSDSAGVVVVHNPAGGGWAPGAGWRLEPDLEIGGDPARPETLFGRVADVAADAVGRIYVLDPQAQTVRVFQEDGGSAESLGGPGDGPGEMSGFTTSLVVSGDTVMVADWGRGVVHRYRPDGEVLEPLAIPGSSASRTWWRRGGDGRVVARSLERWVDEEGRWRGRDRLVRPGPDGGRADTVLTFDYAETDLGGPDAVLVALQVNRPTWDVLPDGRVVWTDLESDRIRFLDPSGDLERLVGSDDWTRREATAPDVRTMTERLRERMGMLGGDPAVVDRLEVVAPERLPAVTSVRSGPGGTVWIQRMGPTEAIHPDAVNTPEPPTGYGGRQWDVLDGEGRLLGTVEAPPRFRLMRIGDDAVWGVARDAVDVERVVRLRIVGGAGSG